MEQNIHTANRVDDLPSLAFDFVNLNRLLDEGILDKIRHDLRIKYAGFPLKNSCQKILHRIICSQPFTSGQVG
jgi:hypothetical protein